MGFSVCTDTKPTLVVEMELQTLKYFTLTDEERVEKIAREAGRWKVVICGSVSQSRARAALS